MTKSTPDDLAVTFRSLERRQQEAIGASDVTDAVEGVAGELQRHVAAAAAILRVPADAAVVADAIESRPADVWTVESLDALRDLAFDVGRTLRRLAAITGVDDEDGDD